MAKVRALDSKLAKSTLAGKAMRNKVNTMDLVEEDPNVSVSSVNKTQQSKKGKPPSAKKKPLTAKEKAAEAERRMNEQMDPDDTSTFMTGVFTSQAKAPSDHQHSRPQSSKKPKVSTNPW